MDTVHNVPVPERFLPLVHRVLAEAYADDAITGSSDPSIPTAARNWIERYWTEDEVALAYQESSPTLQAILDYLTLNHERAVPALELARVAYPHDSDDVAEGRLYGVFGGMSSRCHNRYRKHSFIKHGRERKPDGTSGGMVYRMPAEIAAWLRKAPVV
jgi:hypothetical protein